MPPQPNPFFSTVLNPQPPSAPPPTVTPVPQAGPPPPFPSNPSSANVTPPRARQQHRTNQPAFTPEQRSLQARNKPFSSPSAAEELREEQEKRAEAAGILQSVEMLIWYANARNESISSTRNHFQNILLGLKSPPDLYPDEFEVPPEQRNHPPRSPHGASPGGSLKGKEKAKKRT